MVKARFPAAKQLRIKFYLKVCMDMYLKSFITDKTVQKVCFVKITRIARHFDTKGTCSNLILLVVEQVSNGPHKYFQ